MEKSMVALSNGSQARIHWTVKLAAFVASVITLSWFFAGWRQVNADASPVNWALLGGGVVLTVLLVGLQGYWIYFEEKARGRLRKRIRLFELINDRLLAGAKVGEGSIEQGEQSTHE